jgi:hypothetical protein
MPYITKYGRMRLETEIAKLVDNIETEGDLTYVITRLCIGFWNRKVQCYQTLTKIVGVLECAKHEFYRRLVSVYEDIKIKENGDVY